MKKFGYKSLTVVSPVFEKPVRYKMATRKDNMSNIFHSMHYWE